MFGSPFASIALTVNVLLPAVAVSIGAPLATSPAQVVTGASVPASGLHE